MRNSSPSKNMFDGSAYGTRMSRRQLKAKEGLENRGSFQNIRTSLKYKAGLTGISLKKIVLNKQVISEFKILQW